MAEFIWPPKGGSTPGTVIGPGSSTDNAVARFNGVTGESIQNSGVIIDDSDNVTGVESITVDGLTASRAVVTDGSKKLASSATTATELGYVSGVTGPIQTALDAKIPLTQKGAANGVATLGSDSKIPSNQLPAIAITDTFVVNSQAAMLALSSAEQGDVAVRTDVNKSFILTQSPPSTLANWQELLTPTDTVLSVNGQTGSVVLTTTNIAEGSNLYFTDERAQDAIGTILTDTNDIDLTYNDGTPSITADLRSTSITAKTEVTADVADYVMISDTSDSGNLKKADLGDFLLIDATQTSSNKTFNSPILDTPNIDNGSIWEQISTPSNPSAGFSKLYPKTDGNFYTKDSSGVEVQLGASSSGTGSLNIVDNPSAISNTTGWTAATNYTVSRDTSNSPLAGVIDSCFAISTTTASSESSTSGVYAASLAMPAALRNSKVQGNLWVTVPATSAGVWRLSVYNASGTRMALDRDSSGVWTLPGGFTGQLPFTFDADSSATYTVSFTQTTRTSANTLYVTLISIGNGNVSQTAPVGGWTSFNLASALTNEGTLTNSTAWYRQMGSDMEVIFSTEMTNPSAQILFTPPVGTLDTSKLSQVSGTDSVLGVIKILDVGTATYVGNVTYTPGTGIRFFANGAGQISAGSPMVWVAGDNWTAQFRIPIAEWAGSVNTAPVPAEEFAYTSGSFDSASSTTAFGPGGQATTALTNDRIKTITWQYPIQQGDEVIVEGSRDGVSWAPMDGFLFSTGPVVRGVDSGGGFSGFSHYNSATQTVVTFYTNMNRANDDAPATGWPASGAYWRVRKIRKASLPFANAGKDGSSGLYKAGEAPGLVTGAAIGAGYVGEVLTGSLARASATSITSTATGVAITSRALTPGTWLVSGVVGFTGTATATGQLRAAITTSNGGTPSATEFDSGLAVSTSASCALGTIDQLMAIQPVVITTSGSPTYYLNVYAVFSGGTCTAYGQIRAVRIA